MARNLFVFSFAVWFIGCAEPRNQPTAPKSAPRAARTEADRGPVKVIVEVAPEPVRLSDEPTLTLTIEYEPGIEILKPPFGEALGDFIIRDYREPLPESTGQRQIARQVYKLEPTRAGPSQIDPIVVAFVDRRLTGDGQRHTVETEALTINVVLSAGQAAPTLANLKGPAGPVEIPEDSRATWWMVGGAGGLIGLALTGWLWRRKQTRPVGEPTPRELAEQELAALWRSNSARHEVKTFYVELTGIVRRYIERTTTIHAPEQTTEEFLRAIGNATIFSREERQRLQEFLESADLVKFAAHRPVFADIEQSFHRAGAFVGLSDREAAA